MKELKKLLNNIIKSNDTLKNGQTSDIKQLAKCLKGMVENFEVVEAVNNHSFWSLDSIFIKKIKEYNTTGDTKMHFVKLDNGRVMIINWNGSHWDQKIYLLEEAR